MAQSNTKSKEQTKKKTTKTTKTTPKNKPGPAAAPVKKEREIKLPGRVIAAVVCGFASLLVTLGMFTQEGFAVGGLCNLIKGFFGYGFWACAPMLIAATVILGFFRDRPIKLRLVCAFLTPLFLGALLDTVLSKLVVENLGGLFKIIGTLFTSGKLMKCGGVLGGLLAFLFQKAFSFYGAAIILTVCVAFFLLCTFGVILSGRERQKEEAPSDKETEPGPEVIKPHGEHTSKKDIPFEDEFIPRGTKPSEEKTVSEEKEPVSFGKRKRSGSDKDKKEAPQKPKEPAPTVFEFEDAQEGEVELTGEGQTKAGEISDPPKKKMTEKELADETEAVASEIAASEKSEEYEKPPIYLLKKGHTTAANADEEVRINRERLEQAITSFGVNARVVSTTHGPTVTRYDVELDQGVKLSRLTNLSGDIALALGVVSVRIAPIPEKISTVGIEVPNKVVSTVYLRDIIDSPRFAASKSDLSFAIGKDIGGDAIVGNISKLPHLLIAGTTGSGKSVCMNSLIISLLYKSKPEDVRLIMIDPKMVELGVYNGIPHLYVPVVTDPKKAAGALQWAVTEMLKRYRLFSEIGVRNLEAYNRYLLQNGQEKMPNVVVVIDELADLMLVASKEVEECICRVAQMGRAAGMHLVIATQRPSADVITGLMKANIPSRIAFAVSSAMESRIILDANGAEKLIGQGDMLYAPLGCGKPLRVQGAFVSDDERESVVGFIKEQSGARYSDDIMAHIEKAAEEKSSGGKNADEDEGEVGRTEYDELLPQAVDVIFETKQASVSMLQRRLKLGYSRAARIIDQMEELGVVGPFEGSKPRQILLTRDQWLEMQTTHGTAPIETLTAYSETDFGSDDDE